MKQILITETKLHLREPWSILFTLGLPLTLLVALGHIPDLSKPDPNLGGERFVDVQLPVSMMLLALCTVAFNVLPGVLATYRKQGVLRRMSTTPASPAAMLTVQLLINTALGAVAVVVLLAAGRLVFGSALPSGVAFVPVLLLGTAALMAIGLLIAAVAPSAKSAPLIGTAVMFPLLFMAGMWIPRDVMPAALKTISDYSVAGPFVQALRDTWSGQPPQLAHLAVVALGVLLFGGLAVRLFRWE
ncbi:ABC transporter permease [Nonomuraea sp. NPDC050310]|uniref:ABC transporter permease n=1 Tax=Nonomuraea sp. NPDC050310 TaxID=3154935 RepID=UPI0033CCBA34